MKKKRFKNSFVVTVFTDAEVKQKHLAAAIRGGLQFADELFDADNNCLSRHADITKVTVTPIGEK